MTRIRGSVQISSQRGLSPCELSKSGSFGGSGGMQRPESRFLAFHVSAPSHPPLNLLSLSVRGWISEGSIATGSKFLQLMDLCLRISHLNLLQIYRGTANHDCKHVKFKSVASLNLISIKNFCFELDIRYCTYFHLSKFLCLILKSAFHFLNLG